MKWQNNTFTLLFAVMLSVSAGTASLSPFLPMYFSSFAGGALSLAWVMAGYSLAKILSGWAGGKFSSGTGCVPLIRCGAGLCLAASAGYLILPANAFGLLVIQTVYGAGIGFIRPMATAHIGKSCHENTMGHTIGTFEVAFYAALSIGPFLGGYVSSTYGINALFSVVIFLNLVAFVLCFFISENHEKIYSYKKIGCNTQQKLLMFYIFCRTYGIVAMSFFMPFYLSSYFNMTNMMIGITASILCLVSAISMPLCGYISDRYDRTQIFFISSIGVSVITLFFPVVKYEWCFWILIIPLGFLSALSKTSSATLLLCSCNKNQRGYLMGLFNTFMNIGFASATFTGGLMIKTESFGVDSIFYYSGFIGILGACIYIGLLSVLRQRIIAEPPITKKAVIRG